MITPGPVVITAGFIGYVVAGLLGAVAAAVAVFAPPFLIVMFGAIADAAVTLGKRALTAGGIGLLVVSRQPLDLSL